MNMIAIKTVTRTIALICLISTFAITSNDVQAQKADIGTDPLEWYGEPHSVFSSEVKMSVKTPDMAGELEYRFECVGCADFSSDWQASNEFKYSALMPETTISYRASVRVVGTENEIIPSTKVIEVTTRRNTNTDRSRYMVEIDEAFKNGKIELIPIRVTGDKDNRINFSVINRWVEGKPDPYKGPELREEFVSDVKHAFRSFEPGDELAMAPYPEYREFFNLYAIWWEDMPVFDRQKGITPVDLDEIRDRLFLPWNREGRGWVSTLAMLNTDGGGGGAARNITTRTGNAMIAGRRTQDFIHEFSHTAPGLPDEYTSNGVWGRGAEGSNTSLDFLREKVKWRKWIEPDTEVPTPYSPENLDKVGVFEGGTHRLHHIYRATARGCVLGAGSFAGKPTSLCPICIQRTVARLYMWVDPFDNSYPARKELEVTTAGNVHFSVDKIANDNGTQKLAWFLNGKAIAGDVTEVDVMLEPGEKYLVECRLIDETKSVRPDPPYVDYPVASVKWAVNQKLDSQTISNMLVVKNEETANEAVNKGAGNISVSVLATTPSTGNQNNGIATIKVEGGNAPYTFVWSDGKVSNEPTRHFLAPGNHTVKISDSENYIKAQQVEIGKAPAFYVNDLEFKESSKGKVSISNPNSDYAYFWYNEDHPEYVPKFPNGKFYGSGKKANGEEFIAEATVVENRGGIFIKDTAKNDYGSWIALKVYANGENELPVNFNISTSQNGRFDAQRIIKDQKTEEIGYDDNYQYSTEAVDITWNGIIKDGYLELYEKGYLNSTMKLTYSGFYDGRKEAISEGKDFEPAQSGNYYVEARNLKTGARSLNRQGVAITEKTKRNTNKTISPADVKSSVLQMWLDGDDLNADGKPDGKLFRRGSANGGKSKAGELNFHFFNYFPNAQNGKPSLSWSTIWVQRLSEAVNNYQTIIMVRKESDFSSKGTAPWRELDDLMGIGDYKEQLFADNLSPAITNGNVWVNGEKADINSARMPEDYYIATYEFTEVMDQPFKITNGHWEGEVTEVLVFNSKLTEKERQGVEEYLYQKWISGVSYKE